jgi:hypothetical protein
MPPFLEAAGPKERLFLAGATVLVVVVGWLLLRAK